MSPTSSAARRRRHRCCTCCKEAGVWSNTPANPHFARQRRAERDEEERQARALAEQIERACKVQRADGDAEPDRNGTDAIETAAEVKHIERCIQRRCENDL